MWTLSGFADEISPEPEVQASVLTELGVRYVEFRSAWRVNVLDLTDEQLTEAIEVFTRHDIGFSSVGSPIGKISILDDFEEHLRRFERALYVSKELAAPYMRISSFFMPEGSDPAVHRDEVLRRLAALAARAADAGVVLLHENEKKIYGDVPDRCLDIVESVGSDHLRIAWDAANFVQCGVPPFTEGYAQLRPYLAYVQVKDALLADGRVVPAGEGDGEVRETVRALKGDGFDGYFSMEPHLAAGGSFGGYSGPDLFRRATTAFTTVLDQEHVEYR